MNKFVWQTSSARILTFAFVCITQRTLVYGNMFTVSAPTGVWLAFVRYLYTKGISQCLPSQSGWSQHPCTGRKRAYQGWRLCSPARRVEPVGLQLTCTCGRSRTPAHPRRGSEGPFCHSGLWPRVGIENIYPYHLQSSPKCSCASSFMQRRPHQIPQCSR